MNTRTCTIEGCDRPYSCKGYCQRHYVRWKKYGDPMTVHPGGGKIKIPPSERFWSYVDRSAGPDGCWLWTGYTSPLGYGVFHVHAGGGRKGIPIHRFSYTDTHGSIPDGLEIDHLCRNPTCVNPAHLEAVTRRENIMRSTNFTAVHARKTHCINGHSLDAANVYMWRGIRYCRTCRRERNRIAQRKHPVS